MTDKFENHLTGLRDPIESAQEVTPSDTDELENLSRAIYVGSSGTLRVSMKDGAVVTFQAGQGWHPIRIRKVWATGTSAVSIVACT